MNKEQENWEKVKYHLKHLKKTAEGQNLSWYVARAKIALQSLSKARQKDKENFIKRLKGIVGENEKITDEERAYENITILSQKIGRNHAKAEIRKRISNLIKALKD